MVSSLSDFLKSIKKMKITSFSIFALQSNLLFINSNNWLEMPNLNLFHQIFSSRKIFLHKRMNIFSWFCFFIPIPVSFTENFIVEMASSSDATLMVNCIDLFREF
jgi:hypothetical protein